MNNALSSLKSFIDVNELDIRTPLPTLLAENSADDHTHIYGMRLHQVDEKTLRSELRRARSENNLTGIVYLVKDTRREDLLHRWTRRPSSDRARAHRRHHRI